jgi:hypothetical protein
MARLILLCLVIFNLIVTFSTAIRTITKPEYVFDIKFVNSFFRQSWSFFAPYPAVSATEGEFKCLYEDRVEPWANIGKELELQRSPLTKIFFSNNVDYLVDSLIEQAVWGVSPVAYEICERGDCSVVRQSLENSIGYKKLKRISKELCQHKIQDGLLGVKLRIIVKNVAYFSEHKSKGHKYINDILEMPAYEY